MSAGPNWAVMAEDGAGLEPVTPAETKHPMTRPSWSMGLQVLPELTRSPFPFLSCAGRDHRDGGTIAWDNDQDGELSEAARAQERFDWH